MGRLPTEASFLKDVAAHEMTVLRDDGLYRHLRFGRPGTFNMRFDLTTWPGFLCFSGDMGCYVFSRIPDMLDFFRDDTRVEGPLSINPGYWGEKVQAVDRHSPLTEYDRETFKAAVERWLDDAEADPKLRAAVADSVLSRADDGEHEALRAAMEFEHDGFQFNDFWEVNVREISCRFLWCCYALAWAARTYESKKAVTVDSREAAGD